MLSLRTLSAAAVAAGAGFAAIGGASAQQAPALFIQSDLVRGVLQGMKAPGCVLDNQFHHKEEVVFRVRVVDAKTGKELDRDGLASVVVELADGQKFRAHWGKHPPQDPIQYFWTYAWVIPANYPTGSFAYKIVATDKAGHSATFEPFKSKPSQLTVLADSAG